MSHRNVTAKNPLVAVKTEVTDGTAFAKLQTMLLQQSTMKRLDAHLTGLPQEAIKCAIASRAGELCRKLRRSVTDEWENFAVYSA